EGVPVKDRATAVNYLAGKCSELVGPNCPGLISPGKSNVGIIPGEICSPGPVGLISRSGTLTYQIVHELSQRGIGQSTCIGMGGDPIHGIGFVEALRMFQADPETEAIALIGEIGGNDEERAADFVTANVSKPVRARTRLAEGWARVLREAAMVLAVVAALGVILGLLLAGSGWVRGASFVDGLRYGWVLVYVFHHAGVEVQTPALHLPAHADV